MSADERAIGALVVTYADAVNDRDVDAWSATWADDATWDLGGGAIAGREAIVAQWQAAMDGLASVVQLVHHGTVDVDVGGEAATGRWSLSEHLTPVGGPDLVVVGTYRDRYVKQDDGWRFAHRHYDVLHRSTNRGEQR